MPLDNHRYSKYFDRIAARLRNFVRFTLRHKHFAVFFVSGCHFALLSIFLKCTSAVCSFCGRIQLSGFSLQCQTMIEILIQAKPFHRVCNNELILFRSLVVVSRGVNHEHRSKHPGLNWTDIADTRRRTNVIIYMPLIFFSFSAELRWQWTQVSLTWVY